MARGDLGCRYLVVCSHASAAHPMRKVLRRGTEAKAARFGCAALLLELERVLAGLDHGQDRREDECADDAEDHDEGERSDKQEKVFLLLCRHEVLERLEANEHLHLVKDGGDEEDNKR